MLSEVLAALSENKLLAILSMGLSFRSGTNLLAEGWSSWISRRGDSQNVRLVGWVWWMGLCHAEFYWLLPFSGCGCCGLGSIVALTERYQSRLLFFFRMFTIVIGGVLGVVLWGWCSMAYLRESMQKFRSVKHLTFHNRLRFVKSWIDPKTSVLLFVRFWPSNR